MGITVDEVRKRVNEALVAAAEAEGGAPKPASPQPQSPPAPAAAPSPPAPPQPAASEPPASSAPAAAGAPAASAAPPKTPKRSRFAGVELPKDRGALIGLGAGVLVVLVFALVLILSGGDSGSNSTEDTSAEGGTTPAASNDPNLTQAALSPVDGSDASGTALFGRLKKNVLLQVTAEGLEPSQSGQSYAVWLSHSGNAMVPVGTAKAPDSGDLAARFQIPAAVLVLVARNAFNEIDVTRTTDATLNAAIAKARRSKSESAYTGSDVMRGKITGPFVDTASKK
jgi:hypothetical protein